MYRQRLWALDHQGRLREIPDIAVEVLTFGASGFVHLYAGHTESLSHRGTLKAFRFAGYAINALAKRGFIQYDPERRRWATVAKAQSLVTDRGHLVDARLVLAELQGRFASKKAMLFLLPRQGRSTGKGWHFTGGGRGGLVSSTRRAQAAHEAGTDGEAPPAMRGRHRAVMGVALDPDYFGYHKSNRCWKSQRKVRKQWMRQ